MSGAADEWRRWLGLFFLAVAGGMLIWGQTVLKPHLDGFAFLVYWLLCFGLTMAAIVVALLDLRATRVRARREREDLLRQTLDEIDSEIHERTCASPGGGEPLRHPTRRPDQPLGG